MGFRKFITVSNLLQEKRQQKLKVKKTIHQEDEPEPVVPDPPPDPSPPVGPSSSRAGPSAPVAQPPRERTEGQRQRVTPGDFRTLLPALGSEPGMSGKHDRAKKCLHCISLSLEAGNIMYLLCMNYVVLFCAYFNCKICLCDPIMLVR